MDAKQLMSLSADDVRRDSELMRSYIELFEKTFGRRPSCAGCTFQTDWRYLRETINGKRNPQVEFQTKKSMGNYKIDTKYAGKIFSYQKKGEAIVRIYGRNMNDEFAENYLKYSNDPERKSYFTQVPEKKAPKKKAPEKKSDSKKESKKTK